MTNRYFLSLKEEILVHLKDAFQNLAIELEQKENIAIKDELKQSLENLQIESIREESFGDYACTGAMDKKIREVYAKLKAEYKQPRNLATAISDILKKKKAKQAIFKNIEVAGPGFINLHLAPEIIVKHLLHLLALKKKALCLPQKLQNNIILEYISANPTGPLNVVSARAAALGDSCSNLLEAVGHRVSREYYVNDYGNQIQLLAKSIFLRYLENNGSILSFSPDNNEIRGDENKTELNKDNTGLPFPTEAYHGDYIKEISKELFTSTIQNNIKDDNNDKYKMPTLSKEKLNHFKALSKEKNNTAEFDKLIESTEIQSYLAKIATQAVQLILAKQKQSLSKFRVSFDNYFKESSLHATKALDAVYQKLEADIYSKDGALFFASTKYGDDKDRVIIRGDGRSTYFLADIAYHADKIKRNFTHIYSIWGPDHHGYIARLTGAVKALGYKGIFKVLLAQQVNILEDGQSIRMSKRKGRLISLDELIAEVPVDVLRYFFAMLSFNTPMDFDFRVAQDNSDKNPYYYVAYAHARICSIFRRAEKENIKPLAPEELKDYILAKNNDNSSENGTQPWEWTIQRRRLILETVRFVERMHEAAFALEPHQINNYLYQIAGLLSQFYGPEENRIIKQEAKLASCLLSVIEAVRLCLQIGLELLGTKAPQEMRKEKTD